MNTAEDYLMTKKKWRDLERANIRNMLKLVYRNAHEAQPKFFESALGVIVPLFLCALMVLFAIGARGCEPGPAQAGETGERSLSQVSRTGTLIKQKRTIGALNVRKGVIPYSDQEIVAAIYQTEGGKNAQFPYGIRSVHCSGEKDCRKICFNTVRNNRQRFANSERLSSEDFIGFLAKRYCPTGGASLSSAEQKLNGNWEQNLRYILAKNRMRGWK